MSFVKHQRNYKNSGKMFAASMGTFNKNYCQQCNKYQSSPNSSDIEELEYLGEKEYLKRKKKELNILNYCVCHY